MIEAKIIITIALVFVFCVAIAIVGIYAINKKNASSNAFSSIINNQRSTSEASGVTGARTKGSLEDSLKKSRIKRNSSKLTIEKKMIYAQWKMSPTVFRLFQIVIGFIAFSIVQLKFNIVWQVISLFIGMFFMNGLLSGAMKRRSKAFDKDYPQFLSSLVGLLKTGMNPMTGIKASIEGLEDTSLLKSECEIMLERLRYGVSEDQSIGSFAEDIHHPETELFVQALLLSRKVGGTLSETLERISKQSRRRQYFRLQAVAAVSMQRGSIWFIILIMVCLEAYLLIIYPQVITDSLKDPTGWQVWQFGLLLIAGGLWWVRKVTEIKV